MGLQQAQAHLLDPVQFEANLGSGTDEAAFLQSQGLLDADCQFGTKWEDGAFEDPNNFFNQFFTVTETDGQTWHVTWNLTGSGFTLGGLLIKDGSVSPGSGDSVYRFYGVSDNELLVGSGDVSFADLDRDISHLSFFVCPGGAVPDGGTTVMLLGAALGALGMARRFLMG
jgi:hypothetical protein